MMANKIETIKLFIEEKGLDCALFFKPENSKYVSGFTGSSGYTVLTADKTIFATDFRYLEQAGKECTGFSVTALNDEYRIFDLLRDLGVKRIGLEEEWATVRFSRSVSEHIEGAKIADCESIVKKMRMKKDGEEIKAISKACAIADEAFAEILPFLRPGVLERDILIELQYFMKKRGAEATPDTFIVASGIRSSLPHGVASDKALETGDFLTLDYACRYKGYWSDMTRTVVLGKASDKQREIYGIVHDAQALVGMSLRPGMLGSDADRIARDFISRAGYGKEFGHGLGHGVGMEIHEMPRLSQSEQGRVMLEPGMVVTNEPGIYIQGFGGVRIEDVVAITEDGCDILSRSSKELLEI